MNKEQVNAATKDMTEWLAHPAELGKEPAKIECAGEFDLHEMHYYIFKYKESPRGKWLLGVCGGYEGDALENCGHDSVRWTNLTRRMLLSRRPPWSSICVNI